MKCKTFEMAKKQKVGQEMLLEERQAVFNFPKWIQSSVWRLRIGIKLDIRWWRAMVESPWPLLSWQVCMVWNLTLNKWRGHKVQRIHLRCALGKRATHPSWIHSVWRQTFLLRWTSPAFRIINGVMICPLGHFGCFDHIVGSIFWIINQHLLLWSPMMWSWTLIRDRR